MGPCFEFKIRRFKWADPELRKKTFPPKKSQNKKVKTTELKEYVSTIHLGKQNIDDVTKTVKKPKALKNKRKRAPEEDGDNDAESDNHQNKKTLSDKEEFEN